jgi:hypothetical protein
MATPIAHQGATAGAKVIKGAPRVCDHTISSSEEGGAHGRLGADGETEPLRLRARARAVGPERNTLLVSSEAQFLWHRLELGPAPKATVRFLTCTFVQ